MGYIIRVVKMNFEPEKVDDFLEVFNASKEKIRNFPGCSHLELWDDVNQASVFFTFSHWKDEQALEKYRKSELFLETWSKTKKLFKEKPQAWSVNKRYSST